MTITRRFFHQSFAAPPRNPRYIGEQMVWSHDLHRIRDTSALLELTSALQQAGYLFEETILGLYPPGALALAPEFKDGDLLVLTTRPPLDDTSVDGEPSVNPIHGSGSSQERAVLEMLRTVFLAHSTRTELSLRDPLYNCLKAKPLLNERVLSFYSRAGRLDRDRDKTVCFLFRAPQIQGMPAKVGCLCSFGMAGIENLIWARTLRKERDTLARVIANSKEWLIVVGVGTLTPYPDPKIRPLTLAFADDFQQRWEIHTASAPAPEGPWKAI